MNKNVCSVAVLVLLVICGWLVPAAQAQKTTAWSGAGGDNLWSNAANWTNGVPTDNKADRVNIIGTVGSPYTVNLGGASLLVRLNKMTISDTTITNGTLDWDFGWVNEGYLFATNVTFAPNAKVDRLCASVVFSNVTYNNTAKIFTTSRETRTHRYMGGNLYGGGWRIAPAYAWSTIHRVFIEGYDGPAGGYHYGTAIAMGDQSADNGQSFLFLNNTRVRTGNCNVGWNGSSEPAALINAQSTLSLTNSKLNVGLLLNLHSNAIFRATASEVEFWPVGGVVTDGLRNRMTNAAAFDGEGLTVWGMTENVGMTYEVSGVDTGAVFAGFHDNYSIDQLKFGLRNMYHTTPKIVFTNTYDNNVQPGNEALYVDQLTEVDNIDKTGVDPTFTLNLNGLNVYYKKYVNSANVPMAVSNGTLTQVTGASFFAASGYIHALEGAQAFVKGASPVAIAADYGSVNVSGFPAAKALSAKLVVSGTQPNIDALRTELSGTGSGSQITLSYPQGSDGGTMFFDWNFSHRSVTLTSLEVTQSAHGTMMIIQ
jgi:hypothetical protein